MIVNTEQGSATSARPQESAGNIDGWGVIVAHVANSVGAWGAGFVLAIDELSPIPRKAYKEMARRCNGNIPLGEVQFCEIEPNFWVANMVAQRGVDKSKSQGGRLVDYKALDKCLEVVFERAVKLGCHVHVPSGMGSGLAGGSEKMIHGMIDTRALSIGMSLLEQRMTFVPRVTKWEFQDTSAVSYVGKTSVDDEISQGATQVAIDEGKSVPKQTMVDSVFGTPDNTDADGELLDMDDIMSDL